MSTILDALERVIAERKASPPGARSYVRSLLDGGVPRIGAKVLEEAAEVVEAAGEPGVEGRLHLVREAADLIFHTMVMLAAGDVALADVEAELARRFGVGGLDEKANRVPT